MNPAAPPPSSVLLGSTMLLRRGGLLLDAQGEADALAFRCRRCGGATRPLALHVGFAILAHEPACETLGVLAEAQAAKPMLSRARGRYVELRHVSRQEVQ